MNVERFYLFDIPGSEYSSKQVWWMKQRQKRRWSHSRRLLVLQIDRVSVSQRLVWNVHSSNCCRLLNSPRKHPIQKNITLLLFLNQFIHSRFYFFLQIRCILFEYIEDMVHQIGWSPVIDWFHESSNLICIRTSSWVFGPTVFDKKELKMKLCLLWMNIIIPWMNSLLPHPHLYLASKDFYHLFLLCRLLLKFVTV